MSNFIQITPFLHVRDLERTVTFFTELLGFKALVHRADYAYLHRETAGIRILEVKDAEQAPASNRRYGLYIDVRNVDELYAELKPKLDTLRKGDVQGPADQHYGQRELSILSPDNSLVVFGQPIDPANGPPEA